MAKPMMPTRGRGMGMGMGTLRQPTTPATLPVAPKPGDVKFPRFDRGNRKKKPLAGMNAPTVGVNGQPGWSADFMPAPPKKPLAAG